MLLLENNPIFMFAIIQIPDKTIHRRTEDAGDEDDRDERSVFLQIQILVDWMWIPLDCYDYYSTCSAKSVFLSLTVNVFWQRHKLLVDYLSKIPFKKKC